MKIVLAFIFLFCLGCWALFIPSAPAEVVPSQHLPTEKIIEFSLSRLKESVMKIMQKNDRIAFENNALRQNINDLKQKQEMLDAKKAELLGQPLSSRSSSNQARFEKTYDLNNRKQRTQELITVFEGGITKLKDEIEILDGSLSEENYNSKRRMLLDRKTEIKKDIAQKEKMLISLEKSAEAPLKTIRLLTEEQNRLVHEISLLENALK